MTSEVTFSQFSSSFVSDECCSRSEIIVFGGACLKCQASKLVVNASNHSGVVFIPSKFNSHCLSFHSSSSDACRFMFLWYSLNRIEDLGNSIF